VHVISERALAIVAAVMIMAAFVVAMITLDRLGNDLHRDVARVASRVDRGQIVQASCDGPNRVYVLARNSRGTDQVAVVADDPRCTHH